MSAEVRQWDIGTWIDIDMGEDVSGAVTRKLIYYKPNGETGTWVAVSRGTEVIGYQTVAGDLDIPGTWRIQGFATFATGSWTSTEALLEVNRAFERVV